jgi:hypothetical protein
MALRTPTHPPRAASTTPRRGGRGILVFVFLVAATLGIGYIALKPTLSEPQPEPVTLPVEFFTDYTTFFDDHGAALPQELTADRVRAWANDCASGAMAPNTPRFLPTDELLRARAGWVCLVGAPVPATRTDCNAPGTERSPLRVTIQGGHLIAVRLGGPGDVRDDRGGCMNITPQDRQANSVMRDGMEKQAHTRASSGETVFYLSIPVYFETRFTPSSIYVFVIGSAGASMGQYDNPKHLWESGLGAL